MGFTFKHTPVMSFQKPARSKRFNNLLRRPSIRQIGSIPKQNTIQSLNTNFMYEHERHRMTSTHHQGLGAAGDIGSRNNRMVMGIHQQRPKRGWDVAKSNSPNVRFDFKQSLDSGWVCYRLAANDVASKSDHSVCHLC